MQQTEGKWKISCSHPKQYDHCSWVLNPFSLRFVPDCQNSATFWLFPCTSKKCALFNMSTLACTTPEQHWNIAHIINYNAYLDKWGFNHDILWLHSKVVVQLFAFQNILQCFQCKCSVRITEKIGNWWSLKVWTVF